MQAVSRVGQRIKTRRPVDLCSMFLDPYVIKRARKRFNFVKVPIENVYASIKRMKRFIELEFKPRKHDSLSMFKEHSMKHYRTLKLLN